MSAESTRSTDTDTDTDNSRKEETEMNAELRPHQEVSSRILHILSIYPKVSPSMLQIALNLPAQIWRPILQSMIDRNYIKRDHIVAETPAGRTHTHTILSLGPESPVKVVELSSGRRGESTEDGTNATI